MLCMLYAATDEFHQSFVPSRQAAVQDVLLDSCGSGFGLVAIWGARQRRGREMKRPLLPVALLLIGGILCGELARPGLALLFGASFAVTGAALAWNKGRPWLLGLLLILTGWTEACWHAAILSRHDLRLLLGGEPQIVSLRGVIVAPPSQRIYEREHAESWHSSALIQAREIRLHDAWQPAAGRVIAGVAGILPASIFEGQRVEVTGVIQPPRGPMAAGMFNARAFYKREGVFFQLQTDATNDWKAATEGDSAPGPISERFRQWARKTLALGLPRGRRSAAPDLDAAAGLESAPDRLGGGTVSARGDVSHFRGGRLAHRAAGGHWPGIVAAAATARARSAAGWCCRCSGFTRG